MLSLRYMAFVSRLDRVKLLNIAQKFEASDACNILLRVTLVPQSFRPQTLMRGYYAATVLFLLLDLVLDVNVRIAFFESMPALKAGYYLVCFACLGLVLWQPAWTIIISAFESLVSLVALILSMGIRTMLITDDMLEGHASFVTYQEVINFMISGGFAYIAWFRGMRELRESL